MSASLVGSEMCIRDSPRCTPCPSGSPPRPPSAPTSCWPADRMRAWEGPVSYTHLTLPTICSV
eukprot:13751883-Alexandrium_andersonii.AAC.1